MIFEGYQNPKASRIVSQPASFLNQLEPKNPQNHMVDIGDMINHNYLLNVLRGVGKWDAWGCWMLAVADCLPIWEAPEEARDKTFEARMTLFPASLAAMLVKRGV